MRKRFGRGSDGAIDIIRLHGGDIGQDLLRAGVASGEDFMIRSIGILAADHRLKRSAVQKVGHLRQTAC
jgi:hypothetical protein